MDYSWPLWDGGGVRLGFPCIFLIKKKVLGWLIIPFRGMFYRADAHRERHTKKKEIDGVERLFVRYMEKGGDGRDCRSD